MSADNLKTRETDAVGVESVGLAKPRAAYEPPRIEKRRSVARVTLISGMNGVTGVGLTGGGTPAGKRGRSHDDGLPQRATVPSGLARAGSVPFKLFCSVHERLTMTLRAGDTVRINPRCLLTELGDGTGVVLDLDTKFYFTLNRTGVVVWKELAAQPEGSTADLVAGKIEERFDVGHDAAVRDVLLVLDSMAGEGLVQRSG